MKKILILFLIANIALTGCKTMFAPARNPAMLGEVQLGAALTDTLYGSILAAPILMRSYEASESKYNTIDSLITDLLIKYNDRSKAKDLFRITLLVQKQFLEKKAYHEAKVNLNDGQAKIFRQYMHDGWGYLITAEKALQ